MKNTYRNLFWCNRLVYIFRFLDLVLFTGYCSLPMYACVVYLSLVGFRFGYCLSLWNLQNLTMAKKIKTEVYSLELNLLCLFFLLCRFVFKHQLTCSQLFFKNTKTVYIQLKRLNNPPSTLWTKCNRFLNLDLLKKEISLANFLTDYNSNTIVQRRYLKTLLDVLC